MFFEFVTGKHFFALILKNPCKTRQKKQTPDPLNGPGFFVVSVSQQATITQANPVIRAALP